MKEKPESLVQRNLWSLVSAYLPGALIADRTALENRPASDGSVFLIADHKRDIAWNHASSSEGATCSRD